MMTQLNMMPRLSKQFVAENVVGTKRDFTVRTGVLHFKDDWPGVFIRGDDALGYAGAIRAVLKDEAIRRRWLEDPAASGPCSSLEELAELLESCGVGEPHK